MLRRVVNELELLAEVAKGVLLLTMIDCPVLEAGTLLEAEPVGEACPVLKLAGAVLEACPGFEASPVLELYKCEARSMFSTRRRPVA